MLLLRLLLPSHDLVRIAIRVLSLLLEPPLDVHATSRHHLRGCPDPNVHPVRAHKLARHTMHRPTRAPTYRPIKSSLQTPNFPPQKGGELALFCVVG